jgi:hypothetical protein
MEPGCFKVVTVITLVPRRRADQAEVLSEPAEDERPTRIVPIHNFHGSASRARGQRIIRKASSNRTGY